MILDSSECDIPLTPALEIIQSVVNARLQLLCQLAIRFSKKGVELGIVAGFMEGMHNAILLVPRGGCFTTEAHVPDTVDASCLQVLELQQPNTKYQQWQHI